MLKNLFTIFILFSLSSCITINQYESSNKPVVDKQSNNNNLNKPKSKPPMSKEEKEKLYKLAKDAGKVFRKCLDNLVNVGLMTRQESEEFHQKVNYGLEPQNMILFATLTEKDEFCIKWVPIFSKKDSYVLDKRLNEYWEKRRKKNKY